MVIPVCVCIRNGEYLPRQKYGSDSMGKTFARTNFSRVCCVEIFRMYLFTLNSRIWQKLIPPKFTQGVNDFLLINYLSGFSYFSTVNRFQQFSEQTHTNMHKNNPFLFTDKKQIFCE